jgi:hypothetical protein
MEKRYDEVDLAIIEASGNLRADANEGIFFAQELESVKARTYDKVYADLTAQQVIPVDSTAGAGAETIAYYQYDRVGFAKIISNYSTDLPRVDLRGKKFFADVKSIGVSYGFSVQDIRASRMAGKPLEQRKADAARRANDETVNRIAYFGDEEHGIVGLIDHPNISTYTLPADGTGSSTKFSDKTPDQVIRDLNGMVAKILELTQNKEIPNTLLVGHTTHAYLFSTPRSSTSDTTILDFFMAKNPYVKNIQIVPEFVGAGTGGKDICMIYNKSPEKLTLELPQLFEQFPVQTKGLEYEVPCHSRCAGVLVYYPLSIMKAEGC